ncbi:MAG: DUF2249 domain-containing protein [Polyangiaceae bacterium]|nr:DUF2249 domain-containing protein [Polyangiaceae bacterium]
MRLWLSTAAAPGVALDGLAPGCAGRGLDGVELVLEPSDTPEGGVAAARASAVAVRALRATHPAQLDGALIAARELGVPLSVPPAVGEGLGRAALEAAATTLLGTRGRLLLGFESRLEQAVAAAARIDAAGSPPALGLAWELRPSSEDLRTPGPTLLAAHRHLRLVRLHGGGPEQRDQDGKGVGPLLVDLALSGFQGAISLTPSAPSELARWREWLDSRKLAGCGSAQPEHEHEVDVRDVEPRDRLGTILGAFAALPRGATLKITLDHDPSCMYYALEETQPPNTFEFRKVGDGPEVFRAEVTRV